MFKHLLVKIPSQYRFRLFLMLALLVIFGTFLSWLKAAPILFWLKSTSQKITFTYQKITEDIKIPQQNLCQDCNIILITMTNLRFDHLSSNGYFRPTTPNLDALAKESLVFDNAFAHTSWTLPESISLYTGLYPYQHGITNRYVQDRLSPNIPSLIDYLNQNNYQTAAITGGFDYNPDFGLTSRLSEYQECAGGKLNTYPRQPGQRTLGLGEYGKLPCTVPPALEWLKKNKSKKFFLHVQGFDAHCPFSQKGGITYDPNYQGTIDYSQCLWTFDKIEPKIINGQTYYPVLSSKISTEQIFLNEKDLYHLIAIYDEAITSADGQIGKLLSQVKALGLWDKTIIIFTSEHGDMFGKHGRFMRGGPMRGTFYDDVLHIPLMIRHPKLSPQHFDSLVEQIDLMKTLLGFVNLPQQFQAAGKSLIPLIFKNKEVNSYVFAGSDFNPAASNPYFNKKNRIEVIRDKQWKLIQEIIFEDENSSKTTLTELYNIISDPDELHNLAQIKKDVLEDLQSKLNSWSENVRKKR